MFKTTINPNYKTDWETLRDEHLKDRDVTITLKESDLGSVMAFLQNRIKDVEEKLQKADLKSEGHEQLFRKYLGLDELSRLYSLFDKALPKE